VVSKVIIGYYAGDHHQRVGYHLARVRPGQKVRPLCGAAQELRQAMAWGWTRQALTVDRARERLAKSKRRVCRRCDQLAERLRDPITRLGELVDG